jgi:nucleoid DNA-binding protein
MHVKLPKVKRGTYGFSTEQKPDEEPYINLQERSMKHLLKEIKKKVGYSDEIIRDVVRLMFIAMQEELLAKSHLFLPRLGHLYILKRKNDVHKHWNYKEKAVTYTAVKYHVHFKETASIFSEINKADRKVVGMTYVQFKEFLEKEKMELNKDKQFRRKKGAENTEEVTDAKEI